MEHEGSAAQVIIEVVTTCGSELYRQEHPACHRAHPCGRCATQSWVLPFPQWPHGLWMTEHSTIAEAAARTSQRIQISVGDVREFGLDSLESCSCCMTHGRVSRAEHGMLNASALTNVEPRIGTVALLGIKAHASSLRATSTVELGVCAGRVPRQADIHWAIGPVATTRVRPIHTTITHAYPSS